MGLPASQRLDELDSEGQPVERPGAAETAPRAEFDFGEEFTPGEFDFGEEFTPGTFDKEGIPFTKRKKEPINIRGLLRKTKQRSALTGVEPSGDFIKGLATPLIREKAKENIALTELKNQRRTRETEQAFKEFAFKEGQRFEDIKSRRDIAFGEFEITEGQSFEDFMSRRDIAFEDFTTKDAQDFAAEQAELDRINAIEIAEISKPDSGCIIVTACHGRASEEVSIAREYRDTFLSRDTLRGYYMLAEQMVPVMETNEGYKALIQERLVDHFIATGRYRLGMTGVVATESIAIADGFLRMCDLIGKSTDSFMRSNKEVI